MARANSRTGVKNPKNKYISAKISDRRWKILTDYADNHDRTMTNVLEELIDLLEVGIIETGFRFNQAHKKPFESTVKSSGRAVAEAASERFEAV